MNMKTISLGLGIALIAAIVAAALAVFGMRVLSQPDNKLGERLGSFMESQEKEHDIRFIEIKNVVLTLKSDNQKEHYLLLELALPMVDDAEAERTENMVPVIRGATVELLSGMDYTQVRAMSVDQLNKQLMTAFGSTFKQLHTKMPFKNVIISKMVFQ